MKNGTRIFILSIFIAIWICKPIPYETLAYRIHQREEILSKVLAVAQGGGQGENSNSFVSNVLDLKNKKRISLSFHRRLEQHFPDCNERMAYQQRQEKFYESAMRKKREIKKLRIQEIPNLYSKEELDAISYFQGTGFYIKHQNPKVKSNIFDTRQSFLLKMHDPISRENFLNSFNRRNN